MSIFSNATEQDRIKLVTLAERHKRIKDKRKNRISKQTQKKSAESFKPITKKLT